MNTIDVRTEMRKLADSKPLHAAAGAGVLATETLKELPTRIAKWRDEAKVTSLSTRATEYVNTARARAMDEYGKARARAMGEYGKARARAMGEYDKARARAMDEYDKLAKLGQKALNGPDAPHGKSEFNGKATQPKTTRSKGGAAKASNH
jgi:cell division septum initiation protein DivIVA